MEEIGKSSRVENSDSFYWPAVEKTPESRQYKERELVSD